LLRLGRFEPMILKFEYRGASQDPWIFESSKHFGKINLLVGASGAGKSRFLNALFNLSNVLSHGQRFSGGNWNIEAIIEEFTYKWNLELDNTDSLNAYISNETLLIKSKNGDENLVISRNNNEFLFQNQKLPRMQKDISSVSLLKEEPIMQPFYNMFSHIKRRLFYDAGLRDGMAYEELPLKLLEKIKRDNSIELIWKNELTVNVVMYVLKDIFPDLYTIATKYFMQIFPFIQECDVQIHKSPLLKPSADSIIPAFVVKDKGVTKWINLSELSSGMQKVLLIICDILTLPKGSTYLIDEYENSLGINAIDFLPDFLMNHSAVDSQFFIITHHPYLINRMPMNNWKVFHRQGSIVTIKDGSEFIDKYGKSKQKAFIQLMNDPFYTGETI